MTRKTALSILKADHANVKALFTKIKDTTERGTKTRRDLLERIEQELKAHMMVEEELVYPAVRQAVSSKEGDKMFFEALEEHRAATNVLADLKKTDLASSAFAGRVKVLAELVTHHADEEEEELFPLAKKHMSNDELRELGEAIETRKRQLANGKSRRKDVGGMRLRA